MRCVTMMWSVFKSCRREDAEGERAAQCGVSEDEKFKIRAVRKVGPRFLFGASPPSVFPVHAWITLGGAWQPHQQLHTTD